MAGLEELKKRLEPLFDSEKGPSIGMPLDPCDSYMVKYQYKNQIPRKLICIDIEKQNKVMPCQAHVANRLDRALSSC